MTNEELMKAHFWQSYANIDIWVVQDTAAGKATYFLWNDGTIHERDNEKEILKLAKFLTNTRRSR